jgi:intracellular septation protein
VLYLAFALILGGGKLLTGRDLLSHVMKGMTLPPAVWTRVPWAWTGFFVAMAVANWYVAFHYPTEIWVNFKVFYAMGLALLFALAQGLLVARYVVDERPSKS